MFRLLKAAVFLAPTLSLVLAAVPQVAFPREDITSKALITLDLGGQSDESALQQTTLDLRISESATPCGYGHVTVNGQSLAQDDLGHGSGSIPTDSGSVLAADWTFSCEHLERNIQIQSLSMQIVSVDGHDIENTTFSLKFQQITPVSIFHIDGSAVKLESSNLPSVSDAPHLNLEDELAELETLKEQLIALERSIALKVTHIADSFHLDRPEELLQSVHCRGLKCLFSGIYDRAKTLANHMYHDDEKSPPQNHEIPNWSSGQGRQSPLVSTEAVGPSGAINSPQDLGPQDPELQEPELVSEQDKPEQPMSRLGIDTGYTSQPSQGFLDGPHRALHIAILVVVVLAILMNLAIMILIFQCVRLLRKRRQDRLEKRRGYLRKFRAGCNPLAASKYVDLVQWLRDGFRREDVVDNEKEYTMAHTHDADSDEESSDTMSVSLEEELAQFRAAANAVGNLVVAEEGRGREWERVQLSEQLSFSRSHRASTPSSTRSSCPTYRTIDESLPPYDEHWSPEYMANGFQLTPGTSTAGYSLTDDSASEHSTICTSLDDDIENKD